MAKDKTEKKSEQGITVKKSENFSDWYTQVIQKADLADYSSVSGCIVYKPASYAIWENIVQQVDKRFKKVGIQNAYFPLFIPESLLQKEATHIEGFAPEVAWVTHAGSSELKERLAVRPTSETIMYDSYSKWIRSYNDLPLRLNQWNNVVRWEFKHPTPFLRGREFLWNEGHTCFATKEEAMAEGEEVISIYNDVCENYLAIPCRIGKKSDKEKFAGAEYTISMEYVLPNGKAIQGPDFHHDGQNFSKAFEISFTDDKGEKQYVWQNTFAITTRMLGVMIMLHSDDKGLVVPPKLAQTQAVIVPIIFEKSKKEVLAKAKEIQQKLEKIGITAHLDDRENYSPGWKYHEWEVKGVPIRIELGPRDLEKDQVMVVRRDNSEKQALPISGISKEISLVLEQIHDNLFQRAKILLDSSIVQVESKEEAMESIDKGQIVLVPYCGCGPCEEMFKAETGAKSLNRPLGKEQPKLKKGTSCFNCAKEAKYWFHFGKSY
ncbi:proline--tRNA ligase [archaeon]|jgi:prolyl-tRNA synthetase|nr:proline--tRNA ligase [archaeon]MBT3451712.1 proline--tRNA ligase [archaeon]MBT6869800.1 proline--tRNA ligase [archaeon]MBT7192755.1 proline--tRNA ligase [archaeon]MBT7380780.1 proline--tRNA ligase [archaeon]